MGVPKKYQPPDHAKDILWFAVLLQVLMLAGAYWKVPAFKSMPVFIAQLLAPAAIIVIARSWKSAFKYSLLSTFIIPGGVSALLLLTTVVSFILDPRVQAFMLNFGRNLKVSLIVWVMILSISIPALLLGAVARVIWTFFRRAPD